jgi:hypothetical protein
MPLLLMPDESCERVGCEGTDPDVCKGLREMPLLIADESCGRDGCEGVDPEVCSGLRQTSLLALGVSIGAPVIRLAIKLYRSDRHNLDNSEIVLKFLVILP